MAKVFKNNSRRTWQLKKANNLTFYFPAKKEGRR